MNTFFCPGYDVIESSPLQLHLKPFLPDRERFSPVPLFVLKGSPCLSRSCRGPSPALALFDSPRQVGHIQGGFLPRPGAQGSRSFSHCRPACVTFYFGSPESSLVGDPLDPPIACRSHLRVFPSRGSPTEIPLPAPPSVVAHFFLIPYLSGVPFTFTAALVAPPLLRMRDVFFLEQNRLSSTLELCL